MVITRWGHAEIWAGARLGIQGGADIRAGEAHASVSRSCRIGTGRERRWSMVWCAWVSLGWMSGVGTTLRDGLRMGVMSGGLRWVQYQLAIRMNTATSTAVLALTWVAHDCCLSSGLFTRDPDAVVEEENMVPANQDLGQVQGGGIHILSDRIILIYSQRVSRTKAIMEVCHLLPPCCGTSDTIKVIMTNIDLHRTKRT